MRTNKLQFNTFNKEQTPVIVNFEYSSELDDIENFLVYDIAEDVIPENDEINSIEFDLYIWHMGSYSVQCTLQGSKSNYCIDDYIENMHNATEWLEQIPESVMAEIKLFFNERNARKGIRVKKYQEENDSYVELWKVIEPENGKPQYYGRYTYHGEGKWYYVADPLGYCELDHAVSEDVMFICCDDNGNECVRYSNADENPLPTFGVFMRNKWDELCQHIACNKNDMTKEFWAMWYNGQTTLSVNRWLLTFKDPDLYKKEIDEMFGYDENWTGCHRATEIAWEPIPGSEFEYLGRKFQFTKVTNKHDVCDAEWVQFLCTDSPYKMRDNTGSEKPWVQNYGYMGDWFDASVTGKMLDKRSAIDLVAGKLLELYGTKENDNLLYLNLLYVDGNYCYEKSYREVAEALIGTELHKEKVLKLFNELEVRTQNIVFPKSRENKEKIKQMYPGVYGYNWCLV